MMSNRVCDITVLLQLQIFTWSYLGKATFQDVFLYDDKVSILQCSSGIADSQNTGYPSLGVRIESGLTL